MVQTKIKIQYEIMGMENAEIVQATSMHGNSIFKKRSLFYPMDALDPKLLIHDTLEEAEAALEIIAQKDGVVGLKAIILKTYNVI